MPPDVPPPPRPATGAEVARAAGVSRATVSSVLNGRGHLFAPETVARVHEAAARLDYRPSALGRGLVRGHGDLVVLVVPAVTFGTNLQDMADAVAERLAGHGLTLVVHFAGNRPASVLGLVEQVRPVAVVDLGGMGPQLRAGVARLGARVVPAGHAPTPHELGDQGVGRLQVQHLVATGRTRVDHVLLADPRGDLFGPARTTGVREACADAHLPAPRVIAVPLHPDAAAAALAPLVPRGPAGAPPGTGGWGLACYNDLVAATCVRAAALLGLHVPRDVAVVGVDDDPVARLCDPPLTTVAIPAADLADAVLRELLGTPGPGQAGAGPAGAGAAAEGDGTAVPPTDLRSVLVVRSST